MTTYGSVCSGIEAASVAWESLGWKPLWFSEIEKFPSAVLKHHWPDVINLGDMTRISEMVQANWVDAPDVLVGGTPCQAFSVAGLRGGLSDERGQLTLEFVKLANTIDSVRGVGNESVIVWENVPGVLSSKDNAFGYFIAGLAGESEPLISPRGKWTNAGVIIGPQRTVAWRILDAQYFGVAQRRRRVFVVASARTDIDTAAILLEFESMRRDIAPSRERREEVTPFTSSSFGAYSEGVGTIRASGGDLGGGSETLIATFNQQDISVYSDENVIACATKQLSMSCGDDLANTLSASDYKEPQVIALAGNTIGRQPHTGFDESGICYTLTTTDRHAVAYCVNSMAIREGVDDQVRALDSNNVCYTLITGQPHVVAYLPYTVRRLTPVECERLQGFPDNHTNIPWRNKDTSPDGLRYVACGNSMAVPVMKFIGDRINEQLQSNASM